MLQLLATNTNTNANAFDTLLNTIFGDPAIMSFVAGILAFLPLILFLSVIQAIFVFFQPFYFRSMKKSQKRIAEAQEDLYDIETERLEIEKQRLEIEKQKFELEKARLESQGIKVTTTNKK